MTEDKKIADEMVRRDMRRFARSVRDIMPVEAVSFEDQSAWPGGDGDGALMPVTVGVRGRLTRRDAKSCAAMWCEVRRRYPRGIPVIQMLGFDEDPREIGDIPEAARYVRWWARFAGMNSIEAAERYVLDAADADIKLESLNGASPAAYNIGILAACGVFGEEVRQQLNLPPAVKPN